MLNPDELEVAPGFAHENLHGRVFEPATPEELHDALEKAFDYRGDVTLLLRSGESVEGYIFDRRTAVNLKDSLVRLFPRGETTKRAVPYSEIAGVAFTGRDAAAGKSWEAWVRKHREKKAAGEKNIELKPEPLD